MAVLVGLVAIGMLVFLSVEADDPARDGVEPIGRECPEGFPVKGNVNESGERIFHEPGWQFYGRTSPEACFADADAASDAGYRPSEAR